MRRVHFHILIQFRMILYFQKKVFYPEVKNIISHFISVCVGGGSSFHILIQCRMISLFQNKYSTRKLKNHITFYKGDPFTF